MVITTQSWIFHAVTEILPKWEYIFSFLSLRLKQYLTVWFWFCLVGFLKLFICRVLRQGHPEHTTTGYQEIWQTKLNQIYKEQKKGTYTMPNSLLYHSPHFLVWNAAFTASKYSKFPPLSPGGCLNTHLVNISKEYIQNIFNMKEEKLKNWLSAQEWVIFVQEQIPFNAFKDSLNSKVWNKFLTCFLRRWREYTIGNISMKLFPSTSFHKCYSKMTLFNHSLPTNTQCS